MTRNKLFWITFCIVVVCFIESGNGLQGVPTWMCLGVKSPFIEFIADYEMLSNVTVSLNLTDKNAETRQRNKNGLHNLSNFINPITSSNRDEKTFKGVNNTTFTIQSDLLEAKDSRKHQEQHLYDLQQQQIQEIQQHNFNKSTTNKILMDIIKPISTDIHKKPTHDEEESNADHPTIQIIANTNSQHHHEQMNDHNNYPYDDSRDRKVIMPLALKTTLIERERPIPTPMPTLPKPQSNIEDLKKHLLMLQNYSEADKSFQSKFVVFKKPTEAPITTTTTTSTTTTTTTPRTTTMQFPLTIGPMYRTKPSINMPLQNSQILRDVSYPYSRVERVTIVPQVFLQNDQQQPDTDDDNNDRLRAAAVEKEERRKNRKNEKKMKKERKRNNNNKNNNNKLQNMIPPTSTAVPIRSMRQQQRRRNNGSQVLIATTPTAPYIINLNDKGLNGNNNNDNARKLSRTIRSKSNRKRNNQNKMQRDIMMPMETAAVTSNNNKSERVDLNPKHCYEVSGMSKGQQKLCDQFTSIMPAISRGARAAIQECQHQFQHRRWNCTTVEDNTVFGPVSSIGSPEMAFVYAMASAAVTSFIARACRDGQLASCGCSRSARPKQLHEDWTWGGCGDDLEFGYKFSQNFIDIREKERKRGARGLVTIPKTVELMGNETSADNATIILTTTTMNPEEQAKADEMLKLQQKITQEILNSNLKEKEMNELQEKINKEILNSKLFSVNADENIGRKKNRFKTASAKARALMNLHNNEAGRRAVIKKHKVHCTCHGISGSCSLITCWQQLSSIREIGDYLREQYEQSTQVKMNKRGRLQVKDSRYKVPTALDLVYLDESPDWCRANKQLQWPGTHGRKCNRTSTGLDSCSILCCGRGYNTKKIVLYERCNCKFQWCCSVRCETCKRVIQEYTCK